MSRQRIWIVNAALALVLIWGGLRFRTEWGAFGATHQASNLSEATTRGDAKTPAAEASPAVPDTSWTEIASRSPFSFDRSDTNLEVAEAAAAPVAGPKPMLLATFLLGKERLAMMAKPGTDGRSGSRVKVGETFEGWEVVDIQDSAVVVTSNGTRESIAVGRAPVIRSSEKTSSAQASTSSTTSAPAPSQAQPANAAMPAQTAPVNPAAKPMGTGPNALPPAVIPPGTRIEQTPFGYKVVQDPK